jgi:hypothetical protein
MEQTALSLVEAEQMQVEGGVSQSALSSSGIGIESLPDDVLRFNLKTFLSSEDIAKLSETGSKVNEVVTSREVKFKFYEQPHVGKLRVTFKTSPKEVIRLKKSGLANAMPGWRGN